MLICPHVISLSVRVPSRKCVGGARGSGPPPPVSQQQRARALPAAGAAYAHFVPTRGGRSATHLSVLHRLLTDLHWSGSELLRHGCRLPAAVRMSAPPSGGNVRREGTRGQSADSDCVPDSVAGFRKSACSGCGCLRYVPQQRFGLERLVIVVYEHAPPPCGSTGPTARQHARLRSASVTGQYIVCRP